MFQSDLNWEKWLKNGDQYLRAATPKKKVSVFTPEIRYNLLAMSLEGYVMAILDYHNSLPFNHTFTDLVFSLERVVPVNKSLKEKILKYENIQSICSIDKYLRQPPTSSELDDLKQAVCEVGDIAHQTCCAA